MAVESPTRKSWIAPLVTTAGVLGIAQGLAWFVLSLIAILLYQKQLLPTTSEYVPFGRGLYVLYLDSNFDRSDLTEDVTIIIGSKAFNYFMYFYLVFSFLLLVISIAVLWAARTGKSQELRLWKWTINMIILALLDLILLCLLAHDYHQLKIWKVSNGIITTMVDPSTLACVGIVMTLAARGFVLWIINVVLIVIFGKHLYSQLKNKTTATSDQSILNAYTTGGRPPWEMPNSLYIDTDRQGYNNKGFRNDNDNPMLITSSQSFTHLPLNDRDNYENRDRGSNQKGQNPQNNYGGQNNNNNWNKRNQGDNGHYGMSGNNSPLRPVSQTDRSSNVPNQWGQPARTAKIGRQGGQRSPPLNVNPPFIPDPDYSPPGSPRVRGVLRPKSNYAMY